MWRRPHAKQCAARNSRRERRTRIKLSPLRGCLHTLTLCFSSTLTCLENFLPWVNLLKARRKWRRKKPHQTNKKQRHLDGLDEIFAIRSLKRQEQYILLLETWCTFGTLLVVEDRDGEYMKFLCRVVYIGRAIKSRQAHDVKRLKMDRSIDYQCNKSSHIRCNIEHNSSSKINICDHVCSNARVGNNSGEHVTACTGNLNISLIKKMTYEDWRRLI